MAEFRMPSLGADMEAGTLVEWLVKPGDEVHRGDIVAVVETDKGAIEIEIFEDAQIRELLVTPGTKVPVGGPLAEITGTAEAAPAEAPESPEPAERAAPPQAVPERAPALLTTHTEGVVASPAARRLAAERGIDLSAIRGSGPGGAIVSADIPEAPTAAAAKPRRGLDFGEMRKVIGAAMSRSKREIPHYYLQQRADLKAAQDWLTYTNAKRDPADRLLMGSLYVKAVARALREYPEFNGFYGDNGFEPSAAIHVGMAVSIRGGGLIAPAILDTDRLRLDDLMVRMRDLVTRVRAGTLRGSELSEPTVTVSSLGERGVETLYGVIYPPQVAIVGFGTMAERPWAVDGALAVRPVVNITLSADHRVSDGHRGALLLRSIDKLLQDPEELSQ
ncbi:MAG: dihydrolipoamide acetyltransferase family protein [bacterium]